MVVVFIPSFHDAYDAADDGQNIKCICNVSDKLLFSGISNYVSEVNFNSITEVMAMESKSMPIITMIMSFQL